MEESLLWETRHFIYNYFARTGNPPNVEEAARHFKINTYEMDGLFNELHNRHALFLHSPTSKIRMANPFSGIPTDFKVYANDIIYYANCAWDMLGIPAALHSDAIIEAVCAESAETVCIEVKNGELVSENLIIHFPLPFARWYDDLVFT